MHFGEHVTIDGYGGDPALLSERENVLSCMTELLSLLNMHPLTEVQIVEAPDNQIKDPGGWSGFVIIAESHIAVHTFPKRRFVSADVYTCQNGLHADKMIEFFKQKFALEEVETNFIMRGLKYPEHNIV
jgi:S-adenosylmethionine decarboxylase